jgi:hypothetical protein
LRRSDMGNFTQSYQVSLILCTLHIIKEYNIFSDLYSFSKYIITVWKYL